MALRPPRAPALLASTLTRPRTACMSCDNTPTIRGPKQRRHLIASQRRRRPSERRRKCRLPLLVRRGVFIHIIDKYTAVLAPCGQQASPCWLPCLPVRAVNCRHKTRGQKWAQAGWCGSGSQRSASGSAIVPAASVAPPLPDGHIAPVQTLVPKRIRFLSHFHWETMPP